MEHPPGSVIIPCQETARFHGFTMSLANLEMPPGSQRVFAVGTSITDNLNSAIRAMRDKDEWVWLVGDDHVFKPDVLTRLLDREADVIAPLCTRRAAPFPLVHYGEPIVPGSEYRRTVKIRDLPDDDEPFEVEITGSLPLIRRRVLDAVGDPWYAPSGGVMNEEFRFCDLARAAGFRVMVDPSVVTGHISHVVTYPQRRDGEWGLTIAFPQGGHSIFYPGGMEEQTTENLTEARA